MANTKDADDLRKLPCEEWNQQMSSRWEKRKGDVSILANFSGECFRDADLRKRDFRRCSFNNCNLAHSRLSNCRFNGATFIDADVHGASLRKADLSDTTFRNANLRFANLSLTTVSNAIFEACDVFGVSLWGLIGKPKQQKALRVCANKRRDPGDNEPVLTVDGLESASLLYAFAQNDRISEQLDALARRTVLLLGRFGERKMILETLASLLIPHNFVPVIFDFEGQTKRDFTETASALAHLACFIVADIGEPKSVPHELMRIVPLLPSVPVKPVRREGQPTWSMFSYFGRYPWVMEEFVFRDLEHLSAEFDSEILQPCLRQTRR
jgi:hypothetical protein